MTIQESNERERVNRRHLLGFRRFQNAALRALTAAVSVLKDGGDDESSKKALAVKVGDMKSLVSSYKEAVTGERMVLGMGGGNSGDWPEEMIVRWVEDETEAEEGVL